MLSSVPDPVGPDNDRHLLSLQAAAKIVVCAWGDPGGLFERDVQVLRLIRAPYCITKLQSGRPGHPLYKSAKLKPVLL